MMRLRRKIAILGATGSIGGQALDIARRYPERFEVVCLTARASAEKLFELVRTFRPRVAALDVEPKALPEDVRFCEWVFGKDSSARALAMAGADDALCAVVGIVAFVDVPLVFLSARLWRSIHPAVFANKSGGLEPEMKIAAIAAVACFGLVWAGLVGLRTLQIKQKERLDGLAVHGEL